jgi:AcrR family transcriptional regulator
MASELGLRERKKRQTRELIAATAFRLFAEHGFDRVTVAEVARQADVSTATVFNYFPTKEELITSGLEEFLDGLLAAIRDRAEGTPMLEAFRTYVTRPSGLLAKRSPEDDDAIVSAARIFNGSAALLARERQVYDEFTHALADLIRTETRAKGEDITPWVVANAMLGAHRASVDYVRAEILDKGVVPQLPRRLRVQLERACDSLAEGFGSL